MHTERAARRFGAFAAVVALAVSGAAAGPTSARAADSSLKLSLVADPATVCVGGTAKVHARVTDSSGQSVRVGVITFWVNGDAHVSTGNAPSDPRDSAVAAVTDQTAETVTVSATNGGDSVRSVNVTFKVCATAQPSPSPTPSPTKTTTPSPKPTSPTATPTPSPSQSPKPTPTPTRTTAPPVHPTAKPTKPAPQPDPPKPSPTVPQPTPTVTPSPTPTDTPSPVVTPEPTPDVPEPEVPVSPPVVVPPDIDPGTIPPISGTGEPGSAVVVTDETGAAVCTAIVGADGTWRCTPLVPLSDGAHELTAAMTPGTGPLALSAPVQVWQGASTPAVQLAYDSRKRGQKQTVTGAGWAPGETVHIAVYSGPLDLGTVTARADGTLPSKSFTVAADWAVGKHTVVAIGSYSGTFETTFQVAPGAVAKDDTGKGTQTSGGSSSGSSDVGAGGTILRISPWGVSVAVGAWALMLIVVMSRRRAPLA